MVKTKKVVKKKKVAKKAPKKTSKKVVKRGKMSVDPKMDLMAGKKMMKGMKVM